MYEKPLERLNYFNGQRLEAADLKTEQDYHIRTRRWLNKSLYSAGIARGLEVRAIPPDPAKQDPPRVGVSLGLAIDDDGREIILLEEVLIEVCSYSGTDESTVVGNYLVIEYAEETQAFEKNGDCGVRETGARTSTSTTNFGGPSRVQAKPKLSWIPFLPQPGSNQIVLARVELGSDCTTVHQIDAGIRRYIGAASASKVRQYVLEGEREIAFIPKELFSPPKQNEVDERKNVEVVGRLYFHIRGRQPSAVTLYIRAEPFSPLHYTELGQHTHPATLTGSLGEHRITQDALSHVHTLSNIITDIEKGDDTFSDGASTFQPHQHYLFGTVTNVPVPSAGGTRGMGTVATDAIPQVVGNNTGSDDFLLNILWGRHRHRLIADPPGPLETPGPSKFTEIVLTHPLNTAGSTISPTGVAYPARSGASLTLVDDLQIYVGPVNRELNRTIDIQKQLADAKPTDWIDNAGNPRTLGDGTESHALAINGTGAIRLDFLPRMPFTEGEYCIEFKVRVRANNQPNGGRILYNLYIE